LSDVLLSFPVIFNVSSHFPKNYFKKMENIGGVPVGDGLLAFLKNISE
jgi:hypothetical protein